MQGHSREFSLELPAQLSRIERNNVELEGVLGKGQFGVVRNARYNGTDVVVKASKRDLEAVRSLKREMDAFARVKDHPNIIRMLGVVVDSGGMEGNLVVLEKVDGRYARDVATCTRLCAPWLSGLHARGIH